MLKLNCSFGTTKLQGNTVTGIPSEIIDMGEAYKEDIGGVSFGELAAVSPYWFLPRSRGAPIGFVLGIPSTHTEFDGEMSFCPTAVYLRESYRNKTGRHKDTLKLMLSSLVDTLDKEGFDRLHVFMDGIYASDMTTDIGIEKVLKPFYFLLAEKAKKVGVENPSYPLINMGGSFYDDHFNPVWFFKGLPAYREKALQKRRAAEILSIVSS